MRISDRNRIKDNAEADNLAKEELGFSKSHKKKMVLALPHIGK